MIDLFKLKNQVKHYDWGSPVDIPHLLGVENRGLPWAELWMGVHPGGPSETEFRGRPVSLAELIGGDAERYLGKEGAEQFGALPFLFKLLAAAKPLSIQAHPNKEQAERGFERENRRGIPLDAPNRNYRDANHKPEILCALSPFTAMCGFREPEDISRDLQKLLASAPASLEKGLSPLAEALGEPGTAGALKAFLAALFGLSAETRRELTGYIRGFRRDVEAAAGTAGKYLVRFAELYPGDPAVIAPLYLNLLELKPGEAIYLDAGMLHAYIEGFGVELMANSDNVLRGGLTSKHIDGPELMEVLDFSSRRPRILKPETPVPPYYTYLTSCREFALSTLRGGGEEIPFPEWGPSIVIVTQGEARVPAPGAGLTLLPGESVFIPARPPGEPLFFSGSFTAYIAAPPGPAKTASPL
ncbi:MAG: mannose-6-phosphate isomerase, class I [Treponema sp.]|jgi:mannose-6-phosphate isomerase|nr:mannose-6-phosphate isomerase, class I [Treponema sp.]